MARSGEEPRARAWSHDGATSAPPVPEPSLTEEPHGWALVRAAAASRRLFQPEVRDAETIQRLQQEQALERTKSVRARRLSDVGFNASAPPIEVTRAWQPFTGGIVGGGWLAEAALGAKFLGDGAIWTASALGINLALRLPTDHIIGLVVGPLLANGLWEGACTMLGLLIDPGFAKIPAPNGIPGQKMALSTIFGFAAGPGNALWQPAMLLMTSGTGIVTNGWQALGTGAACAVLFWGIMNVGRAIYAKQHPRQTNSIATWNADNVASDTNLSAFKVTFAALLFCLTATKGNWFSPTGRIARDAAVASLTTFLGYLVGLLVENLIPPLLSCARATITHRTDRRVCRYGASAASSEMGVSLVADGAGAGAGAPPGPFGDASSKV